MPDPAKTAHETETKHSRGLGSYVVWAFVVVMVYVLSSRPMLKIAHNSSPNTHRLLVNVYSPLIWLCNHTLLETPLWGYWKLWLPDVYDRGPGFMP